MRYPQGGRLPPERQVIRECIRLEAAAQRSPSSARCRTRWWNRWVGSSWVGPVPLALVPDVIDDTGLDRRGSAVLGGAALGRARVEDRDKLAGGRPVDPVPDSRSSPGLVRRPANRGEGVAVETGLQGPSPPEHPGQ